MIRDGNCGHQPTVRGVVAATVRVVAGLLIEYAGEGGWITEYLKVQSVRQFTDTAFP